MDNDNPLLQKAADLYRGLRFTMKYRGVDILPAAAGNDLARDLLESGELPPQERKYSIYGPSQVGSFKFLMLHRAVPLMSELSRTDEIILNCKYAVRRACGFADDECSRVCCCTGNPCCGPGSSISTQKRLSPVSTI